MKPALTRRQALVLAGSAFSGPLMAQTASNWSAIEKAARGQTVYFNAWAGSQNINTYLQWAGAEVKKRFGVSLEHVKITDTADVVKRVRNEKAAGKLSGGSVDLVWINGDNFLAMKREKLLFGPFAEQLPHFALVDVQGKPTTRLDFSEPVEGMEAPWGMAQLTFYADTLRVPSPPRSMAELLAFAQAHPGRLSYPRPPDFMGSTFIKQVLLECHADRSAIYQALTPEALTRNSAPLWRFLDALHPHLWRSGKQFPNNAVAIRQMMADGELLLGFTFNPNEAANEIAAKRLQTSVSSYQFRDGTLGNTHFLAIPFNASAQAGAQVLTNFLLSPEAQARKADIALWGDPTVLAIDLLPAMEKARFTARRQAGQVDKFMPVLPEPHGSWVKPLEREWIKRYGQ